MASPLSFWFDNRFNDLVENGRLNQLAIGDVFRNKKRVVQTALLKHFEYPVEL